MKALSLTQPWAWIILHLGKRIENRSRNLGNYRGTLLLHASKGMTLREYFSAFEFVEAQFGHDLASRIPDPKDPLLVRGAIVGACEVVNQCGPGLRWAEPLPLTPRGLGNGIDTRWYMGAHAYVFDQVRELTAPTPCKGALGFWTPPADVGAKIFIHGGTR